MTDDPSPSGSEPTHEPPQAEDGAIGGRADRDEAVSDEAADAAPDAEAVRKEARRRRQERRAARQMTDIAPEVKVVAEAPEVPHHALEEFLHEWRIPLMGIVAVVLFAGTRFEATRPYEATFIALALPALAAVMAALPLRDGHNQLRAAAFGLAALVLLGSELAISRVVFPPDPLDTATLTDAEPGAELAVRKGQDRLEIETRASLAKVNGGASGHFELELTRDGKSRRLTGKFERWSTKGRVPQSGASHNDDVNRQDLDMPGSGTLHAKLISIDGAVAHRLELRLFEATPVAGPLAILLVLLGLGAVAVEAIAVRRGLRSHYASWIGIAVALALYLPPNYNPGDPFNSVLAGLIVAMFAGGGAGLLLGLGATRLVTGR